MLLSHAVAYAEARSYLAALADSAPSPDLAMEYERVLLQIDWLHDSHLPPITVVPTRDRDVLNRVARASIARLEDHGISRFELAICLSMLAAVWEQERPQ